MARVLAIMGESGSGKTTSLRNLDPKKTFYIDCDGKGLTWKGWRKQYNNDNKNYVKTDRIDTVEKVIDRINGTNVMTLARDYTIENPLTQFKYIIVDTINALMISDEMERMKEKGYDKWVDLAASIYKLVKYSGNLRDDLTVIFMAHTETVNEENGYSITRIATSGKKLQKIKLEAYLPVVLMCKTDTDGEHKFIMHSKGMDTVKTPLGAFENDEEENDIVKVLKVLEEY